MFFTLDGEIGTKTNTTLDPGKVGLMWCRVSSGSHTPVFVQLPSLKGTFRVNHCASYCDVKGTAGSPASLVQSNHNLSTIPSRSEDPSYIFGNMTH